MVEYQGFKFRNEQEKNDFLNALGESFQNLGLAVVDTTGNIIASIGINANAAATNAEALANYNANIAEINRQNIEAERQEREQQRKFLLWGVAAIVVLIGFAGLIVTSSK